MSYALGPDGYTVYPQYQVQFATTTSSSSVGNYVLNISLFPNGFPPDTGGFTDDELAEIESCLQAMMTTLAAQSEVLTGSTRLRRLDQAWTSL